MTGGIIYVNYASEKNFVEKIVQNQAHEAVDQYFDSVNTLMISGAMDKREILREKTLKRKDIVEARIFRSKAVKDLFGEGFPHESAKNEIEKKALEGTPYQSITNENGSRILTVITPFRASTNFRGTNCIECHQTPEGTVLGAVKISYSLDNLENQINENVKLTAKIMGVLFLFSLILIALLLKGLVISPIKQFNNLLKEISQNFDLTKRSKETSSRDEIGEMSKSFNSMIIKFHQAMEEVNSTCETLITGSESVYKLTQETQLNLIEQQEETNKVASAVTEMNSTAKIVADNSIKTQNASQIASNETNSGAHKASLANNKIDVLAKQIEKVSSEIEKLEKQSEAINNVISLINDITLKTKLLSFNASVEAARAGEEGKGFTVVAQEIGQLASETKDSTEKITKITNELKLVVNESVKVMLETKTIADEGKSFVSESTNSLKQIANEVSKVNDMATSISDAAKEQSNAANSIDQNLHVIMTLTSKTVQSANEMKKVGDELNQVTTKLENLIKVFKLF
jgi:methyl-accepting chemotaxis protein